MKNKKNNLKIKLVICLGNPAAEYANTYHNAGFLLADYLKKGSEKADAGWKKRKNFEYLELPGYFLAKTLVFMNDSGKAIAMAAKELRCSPEQIAVAHDDSDIEIGKYKLSFARNSAGHRGVESIIKNLRTKNFWRARIGIRKKNDLARRIKAGEFVLQKITPENKNKLEKAFKEISEQLFLAHQKS